MGVPSDTFRKSLSVSSGPAKRFLVRSRIFHIFTLVESQPLKQRLKKGSIILKDLKHYLIR